MSTKPIISTLSMLLSMIILLLVLPSCGPSKQYQMYLETLREVNANRAAPGIHQTFDPNGKLLSQTITLPQAPIIPAQEQPNEWASVFKTAFAVGLPVAGMVMNTYASGEAYSNVLEVAHGPISGSYNSAGSNLSGGNLEIPTTTTTTTETITNPMAGTE